jgi:hypothetical protein
MPKVIINGTMLTTRLVIAGMTSTAELTIAVTFEKSTACALAALIAVTAAPDTVAPTVASLYLYAFISDLNSIFEAPFNV